MSARQLTVDEAFSALHEELNLSWLTGHDSGSRVLTRNMAAELRPRLLGPLNFNSPNRIQLLGAAEVRIFATDHALDSERFEYSLPSSCDMIVVSNGMAPPPGIVLLAEQEQIALFTTPMEYSQLHSRMRFLLIQLMAEREIIHGVMMDVHGTGVLITGDASVGKSELALELISRGHILVADDAPEFTRIAHGTLECQCPPLLRDFLEVRGLGVLNIALMYGDAHTRSRKILRCIVHLQPVIGDDYSSQLEVIAGDRISEPSETRTVLGVNVPRRTIPVAPGRNMAVLVEAVIRDQILRAGGYSASKDLIDKQATAMRLDQGPHRNKRQSRPKSGTEDAKTADKNKQ